MELNTEEKRNQLKSAEAEAARLRKELGMTPPRAEGEPIPSDHVEGLARRLDQLSPAERMELREKNPEEFQTLLDAKERQGWRALFR